MKENEDNESLKEYTIKGIIGNGAFSTVRFGINKKTKEKVAIKILDKSKIMNQKDYMKIVREINMLKSLNHPNVIKIHKACQNANYIYIITELCENGELFYYIVKKKRLSEEESAFFFYQLINGLEHIHKNNIIHRDLKPENLLLSSNNTLKIIDFGLSNYFRNNLLATPCGSACYASPEMLSGQKYNGFMTDVWSTGVILYTMVCGQLPFEDKCDEIIFQKVLACKIAFRKYVGQLSKDLIKKILVKNPEKRITLEQIKKHEFYLKGKEIFYKKHPDLIENKITEENNYYIKMPTDSSKKIDNHYNRTTVNKIKNIEKVINVSLPQPYNCNTISVSKKECNIIKNKLQEESKEAKNTSKSFLNQIQDEKNISETGESKSGPKDNEKSNNVKDKINNKHDFNSISISSTASNVKEKNVESKQKFINLNSKKLNGKSEKTNNSNKNKTKNQNETIIFNSVSITPQVNKIKPNVLISSQRYLTENVNTVIESTRNIIKKKLIYNLYMNNSNESKIEKSDSIVQHNKKFSFKSLINFPKKLHSSKFTTLSKIIKDDNNNSFNINSIENNPSQPQKNKGGNNTIININNNINNPNIYIHIGNISNTQKELFQPPIYSNIKRMKENIQFSIENKNPITQEKKNLKVKNINNVMNENNDTIQINNTYYVPERSNEKIKCGKDTQRIDTNYINNLNPIFNKTIDCLGNNFLKYYLTTLNSSGDGNSKINYLTNLQRYTNKYNKKKFNSCINSNDICPSKGRVISDIDEYGNYNLQEPNENKNISNYCYNSYFRENYIITRPENEKNLLYKIDKTL